MKKDEIRVVEMIDKKTGEKVFHKCSDEESWNIFYNRNQNEKYYILGTMPEYFYDLYYVDMAQ